jgi:hypothetical protein
MPSIISSYFANKSGRIFLADAVGAILSAFFLGIILPLFSDFFSMPIQILHALALIAVVFAIYSFTCYFFAAKNWKFLLKIIMTANAMYCLLTAGLVVYYYPVLTLLGVIYFVLEIIVICFVIWMEQNVLSEKWARK